MALPIFYSKQLAASGPLNLNEETARHIVQVLRMKKGDKLQLADGCGNLTTVTITDDQKRHCTVVVNEQQFFENKNRHVSIAISLLKNAARFEWFLEKATEIGVQEIVPLRCERTEKQHLRFDRMNNILISAMLQSQQVWLPKLHEPLIYNDVITATNHQQKLIAHCADGAKAAINDFKGWQPVQILIGPEGDFTANEIIKAINATYQPLTLGHTRLRTETAGIVAATCLCL